MVCPPCATQLTAMDWKVVLTKQFTTETPLDNPRFIWSIVLFKIKLFLRFFSCYFGGGSTIAHPSVRNFIFSFPCFGLISHQIAFHVFRVYLFHVLQVAPPPLWTFGPNAAAGVLFRGTRNSSRLEAKTRQPRTQQRNRRRAANRHCRPNRCLMCL